MNKRENVILSADGRIYSQVKSVHKKLAYRHLLHGGHCLRLPDAVI